MSYPLILVTDVTGYPFDWLSFRKAVNYVANNKVARQVGAVQFQFYGGTSKTGEQTVISTSSIITLTGRNPNAWKEFTPRLTNTAMFRRDRNICAYCGQSFRDSDLTCDHIIPKGQGGGSTWTNCISSCARCNHFKGCKTPEQARMPLLYVPYVPSTQEALILANRRILQDQMEMLISMVHKRSRLLAA